MSDATHEAGEPAVRTDIQRRDFLYIATGAMAATGTLAAVWPFIDQMNPTSSALAAGGPMSVDLSSVAPGQQIIVRWRSMPIFIVHRTPAMLATLREPSLLDMLRDPQSEETQQPPYARNWSRSEKPDYLVLVGICTHLGCIPTFSPVAGSLIASEPSGWLCHCHGSKYDLAGRVFKGVPAPFNLPVPPYHFTRPTTLMLGENPQGASFDLGSVQQL
ncbi:MAG: ubiquinol-cytochrome c reductase iron-sulfur subunit [Alphaproteobacteria bacterium 64-11]|nr:ubiquinol-cytochrome c reductase iron-sulfur subunit [Alphaproteobacteria bacterium]OJU13635.1 MAG: ubiquinol-cytochrome c reductase iron-sulfur subunit [Alphaproteobacteria bacterium 64-11]